MKKHMKSFINRLYLQLDTIFIELMTNKNKNWAVILGGSGSFGLASAKLLATRGFNLILVYRERRGNLQNLNHEFELLKKKCDLITFNLNANEPINQNLIIDELLKRPELKNRVSFLLHAIADGNLKPLFSNQSLTMDDFNHTIQSMGTSLYLWTRLLHFNGFFAKNSSVLGLTSEGVNRYYQNYAAVASAKSVMESNMRYMAVELAKYGVRANVISAGITDTLALKSFPNYDAFIEGAKKRNPYKRLTIPEDVAKVIAFMASDDSIWINGTVITVDGGEHLINNFDEII